MAILYICLRYVRNPFKNWHCTLLCVHHSSVTTLNRVYSLRYIEYDFDKFSYICGRLAFIFQHTALRPMLKYTKCSAQCLQIAKKIIYSISFGSQNQSIKTRRWCAQQWYGGCGKGLLLYLHVQCAVLGMLFVQYIKRNVFTLGTDCFYMEYRKSFVVYVLCWCGAKKTAKILAREMEYITEKL